MFLSEAELSICLLCVFTGVDYLPRAVLDTITTKMGRMSAKVQKPSPLYGLMFFKQIGIV